ncbi:hypothetical protein BDQ12DRAFT_679831 [Crucibulum laeve]|uniref:RING-type domain-containing protein n=1 Tax=Crucibulum laeve TaxID=68775 RepID=A0A5C3M7M5_9AGAR|nr:hypothetical protein BDQ12DRAFT_679831 [Crucibulum laeve]
MSADEAYVVTNLTQPSLVSSGLHGQAVIATSLKRRASPAFEGMQEEASRKRLKEDQESEDLSVMDNSTSFTSNLADTMAEDLQCGCCSELVYRPVLVLPCQHFFCGSCCSLWIRNGGANCPACRGVSNALVTPFRGLQAVVDTLLRFAPHKARTDRERQQADEIYKPGQSLRFPAPREASPEPPFNQSTEYAYPCPHCAPGNPFGYRCPQPIPDPNTDADHAWPLDNGLPPGHGHCGNCETFVALLAPTTTKCDMCRVSFCGIGVQGRCLAAPILAQHPHGMADLSDLIQSSEVYDCFDRNNVEVEIMFDYLQAQQILPRQIYREVVQHLQSQPYGFAPLFEQELFTEIHNVASVGPDPGPDAPRSRICRLCATEVLLYGLRDWWIRERQKGFLDESVTSRQDCPDGGMCRRQSDLAHAKEFNHIIALTEPQAEIASEPIAVQNPPLPLVPESMASMEPATVAYAAPPTILPTVPESYEPRTDHNITSAMSIPPGSTGLAFLLDLPTDTRSASTSDFHNAARPFS